MANNYVRFYYSWIEETAALSDAERGRLFTALLEYARSGLDPKLSGQERLLFPGLRAKVDHDMAVLAAKSKNGKKGGREKKLNKANESYEKLNKANESYEKLKREEKEEEGSPLVPPSPSPPIPPLSLSPYNPPSPEEEKEEKNAGSDGSPSDKRLRQNSIPYTEVQRLFNSTCKSYSRCTVLSDARKKAISARFNSGYTLEAFERLFAKAEASSFLRGQNNKNWQANFDWLIRDSNMAKVLDGNYDDERRRRGDGGAPQSNGEDRPRKYGNFGIVL